MICFQEIVSIDPGNYAAWSNLGSLQATSGRYDEALESLQWASKANASNEVVWYNLGQVYYLLGQYGQSAMAYKNATMLAPDDAYAWLGLGLAQNQIAQV